MKILLTISIFFLSTNFSYSSENIDCSIFSKLSKDYIVCKSKNLNSNLNKNFNKIKSKTGQVIKNTGDKIKETIVE